MRLSLVIAIALVAAPLAGCLGSETTGSEDLSPAGASSDQPRIETPYGSTTGNNALVFLGERLEAEKSSDACESSNCEEIDVELSLPSDYWSSHEGGLEVSVRQVESGTWYQARILDTDGRVLDESRWATYAGSLLLDEPEAGNYTIEVIAQGGSGPYQAALQVESTPVPDEPSDVLPNIVTMPPIDLAIEHPGPLSQTPAVEGCSTTETVEEGVSRCLRFTNTIANLGEGKLEVRLTFEEGAKAAAGMGEFVQRVYRTDGSVREEAVAGAEFHATHGHWHYEDFAGFELYRYDLEADERGEQVRTQSKSGFCFFDMGIPELDHHGTTPPVYSDEANCFTRPKNDWITGLSPGWYDMYWASLDDQYVDLAGLEDGVYELVTTADAQDSLIQTTRADDAAGAVFRLDGDTVEVLERWSAGTDVWT